MQGAYAKASNTAADSSRNSVFSGKAWFDHLDTKIGNAKLQALFDPEELAHIATIGRAARHINEAVPGVTNGSSSGSMLLNSGLAAALRGLEKSEPSKGMSRAIGGAKLLAVGLGYHSGGVGGAMAGKMAGDATTALQTSLAKVAASKAARRADAAVSETINPALARAMMAKRAAKSSSRADNAALARGVAGRVAPAASNDDEVKTRSRALAKALRG